MIHYISQEEAKHMMEHQDAVILDVREPEEYAVGHIPGSILIPLSAVNDSVIEQFQDKSTCFLIYCRSGRRSKEAASILESLGYVHIYEFGGIIDWPYEIVV